MFLPPISSSPDLKPPFQNKQTFVLVKVDELDLAQKLNHAFSLFRVLDSKIPEIRTLKLNGGSEGVGIIGSDRMLQLFTKVLVLLQVCEASNQEPCRARWCVDALHFDGVEISGERVQFCDAC